MLRTALSLSLVTGRPFELTSVRAGRSKPGLQRQHLACVQAAAALGSARVDGDFLGSMAVRFEPGPVRAGELRYRIGGAGSAVLLLQTVLPAVLGLGRTCKVSVEGGTHNPFAPPFPFLQEAFLPLVTRLGWKTSATLRRPGFFPVGGGCLEVDLHPQEATAPLTLETVVRKEDPRVNVWICHTGVPGQVVERARSRFRGIWGDSIQEAKPFPAGVEPALGSGFSLHLGVEGDRFQNVFSAIGTVGVPVERLVEQASRDLKEFLGSGMAVEENLADQILLPMALGPGGAFTATRGRSRHLETQVEVIHRFLGPRIRSFDLGVGKVRFEVVGRVS